MQILNFKEAELVVINSFPLPYIMLYCLYSIYCPGVEKKGAFGVKSNPLFHLLQKLSTIKATHMG